MLAPPFCPTITLALNPLNHLLHPPPRVVHFDSTKVVHFESTGDILAGPDAILELRSIKFSIPLADVYAEIS